MSSADRALFSFLGSMKNMADVTIDRTYGCIVHFLLLIIMNQAVRQEWKKLKYSKWQDLHII